MRSPAGGGGRGGTVLDSGFLFRLIVNRIEEATRKNPWPEELWPKWQRIRLESLLAHPPRRPLVVPPVVWVEVDHLARSARRTRWRTEDALRLFWRFVLTESRQMALIPEMPPIEDLSLDGIVRYAIVDATIVEAARRREGAAVLRVDCHLRDWVRTARRPAFLPEEVSVEDPP